MTTPSMRTTTFLAAAALSMAIAGQATAAPLGGLFSCKASGDKQATGAVAGAVVGGLIGNSVSKNDRTLGTVLGAAIGATAGQYIGCKMQEDDQKKAEAATRAALAQNSSQRWSNPDSGAYGQVNVGPYNGPASGTTAESYQAISMSGLRLASNVQPASGYVGAPPKFIANSSVNLRAAPSTTSRVLGRIAAGQTVDVLGQVQGTNWLLIGRNGVGQGYVASNLFRVANAALAQPACRTVDQIITVADGSTETKRYIACPTANGEWNFRDA